jgi:hypothetical protein
MNRNTRFRTWATTAAVIVIVIGAHAYAAMKDHEAQFQATAYHV